MMNRLPLRPRQVNTESSLSKPKFNDKGSTLQENTHVPSKLHDTTTKLNTIDDDVSSAAKNINDDNSEVIIEERRIGSDGEEHIIQRYIRGKLLGKGGFAKVYLCTVPENGRFFAVKIVPKANLVKPRARQKLQAEIKIHRAMKHKHVCDFKHYFEDRENCYIILELCECQSMNELIKRRKRLTELETSYFLSQLVDAVSYMHSEKVIHRDLKLGNLFLDKNLHVKVGDFGLAIRLTAPEEKRKTICGTPNYIAPEVIEQDKEKRGHSYEVDIWSMGVICYTLLVGKPPFESRDVKSTYERILSNQYSFPSHISLSDQAKNLVSMILQIDPSQRPSLSQISAHPFIAMFRHKFPVSLPAFCMHTTPCVTLQPDGIFQLCEKNSSNEVSSTFDSTVLKMQPLPNIASTQKFDVFDENTGPMKKPVQQTISSVSGISRSNSSKVIDNVLSKVSQIKLKDESLFNSAKIASNAVEYHAVKTFILDELTDNAVPTSCDFQLDPDTLALVNLHSTLNDGFMNSDHMKFQPKPLKFGNSTRLTNWISHHIDYTSKYGLGFLLNDGSVGVYFNDSTKAVLDPFGENFFYIDRKPQSNSCFDGHIPDVFMLSDFPSHLQKKVILLKHFKNYFMEHCDESYSPSNSSFSKMLYLKKWVRTKHAVFFRLSDNTVQVVFTDNTEILLSADGDNLTYVDKTAARTSYAVDSVLCNHGLAEVKKRLKYLKDILYQLIQSSRK